MKIQKRKSLKAFIDYSLLLFLLCGYTDVQMKCHWQEMLLMSAFHIHFCRHQELVKQRCKFEVSHSLKPSSGKQKKSTMWSNMELSVLHLPGQSSHYCKDRGHTALNQILKITVAISWIYLIWSLKFSWVSSRTEVYSHTHPGNHLCFIPKTTSISRKC